MYLIKTKEQEKLEQARNDLKCLADHLWMKECADGSTWVDFLPCPKCNSFYFCAQRRREIQKDMNK